MQCSSYAGSAGISAVAKVHEIFYTCGSAFYTCGSASGPQLVVKEVIQGVLQGNPFAYRKRGKRV